MVEYSVWRDAQRNILFNWHKLSLGDISTIQLAIIKNDTNIVTTPDTDHCYIWMQLVRLEWAIEVEFPPELFVLGVKLAAFRLTHDGCQTLPRFIDYRKLFHQTIYNNAPRHNKPPLPSQIPGFNDPRLLNPDPESD